MKSPDHWHLVRTTTLALRSYFPIGVFTQVDRYPGQMPGSKVVKRVLAPISSADPTKE